MRGSCLSSKENSVCSRRDFLRSLGRRFREQSQGVETDDTVRQGRAFFAQGDYAMAAHCFRVFLREKEPERTSREQHTAARAFLGASLYWCGQICEALEVLEAASDCRHCLVLLYTGLCLAAEGQTEAALDILGDYKDFSRPLVQRAVNVQLALREEHLPVTAQKMEQEIRQAIEQEKEPLRW